MPDAPRLKPAAISSRGRCRTAAPQRLVRHSGCCPRPGGTRQYFVRGSRRDGGAAGARCSMVSTASAHLTRQSRRMREQGIERLMPAGRQLPAGIHPTRPDQRRQDPQRRDGRDPIRPRRRRPPQDGPGEAEASTATCSTASCLLASPGSSTRSRTVAPGHRPGPMPEGSRPMRTNSPCQFMADLAALSAAGRPSDPDATITAHWSDRDQAVASRLAAGAV